MGFLCGSSPVNTGWISNLIKQMTARIQSLINKLRSFIKQVQDLADQALAAVRSALASIQSAIQSVFAKIQGFLNTAMSHLHDMISSAFSSLQAAFTCSNEQQTKIAVQFSAIARDAYAATVKETMTLQPLTNLPTTTSNLLSQGASAISGAVAGAAVGVLAPFTVSFSHISSVFSTSITLPTFSLSFPTIA